jgi:hypothetical protein
MVGQQSIRVGLCGFAASMSTRPERNESLLAHRKHPG